LKLYAVPVRSHYLAEMLARCSYANPDEPRELISLFVPRLAAKEKDTERESG
jgi:hypothetical protein